MEKKARQTNGVNAKKQKMFARIGSYLKDKREKAGISQQKIAEAMNLTTAQYVSNIERGVSPPSVDFLKHAIELYGLDREELAFKLSKEYHVYCLDEFSQ